MTPPLQVDEELKAAAGDVARELGIELSRLPGAADKERIAKLFEAMLVNFAYTIMAATHRQTTEAFKAANAGEDSAPRQ